MIKAVKEIKNAIDSVELNELFKKVIIIKIEPVLRVVRCLKKSYSNLSASFPVSLLEIVIGTPNNLMSYQYTYNLFLQLIMSIEIMHQIHSNHHSPIPVSNITRPLA